MSAHPDTEERPVTHHAGAGEADLVGQPGTPDASTGANLKPSVRVIDDLGAILRAAPSAGPLDWDDDDSLVRVPLLPRLFEVPDDLRIYRDMDGAAQRVLGPPQSLAGYRSARAPRWIVGGLLSPGALTLISASGGVGKSILTLDLIIRLAAGGGGRWLGTYAIAPDPCKVLVIEAENGIDRLQRRALELDMGESFPPGMVDLASAKLDLRTADQLGDREYALQALTLLLCSGAYQVAVIDPLRVFLPADVEENDNRAVGLLMDFFVKLALRTDTAILVIDHDSKAGAMLRGASAKRDAGAFVVQVKADDRDPNLFTFRLDKARDPGGEREIRIRRVCGLKTAEGFMPLRYVRDNEAEETGKDDRKMRPAPALSALLAYLRGAAGQCFTKRELATAVGVSIESVKRLAEHPEVEPVPVPGGATRYRIRVN